MERVSSIFTLLICLVSSYNCFASTSKIIRIKHKDGHFLLKSKGQGNAFKDINCSSGVSNNSHLKYQCQVFETKSSSFYVVDCYGHDAVASDCNIGFYSEDGTPLSNFKSPFPSLTPKKADAFITQIEGVSVDSSDSLALTAYFQWEKLDGLNSFERNFCIDEECVGYQGATSKAKLKINKLGEVFDIKVLQKATFNWKPSEVMAEIQRGIDDLKARINSKERFSYETDEIFSARIALQKKELKDLETQFKLYSSKQVNSIQGGSK